MNSSLFLAAAVKIDRSISLFPVEQNTFALSMSNQLAGDFILIQIYFLSFSEKNHSSCHDKQQIVLLHS
jgi:hypothetical protein